MIILEFEIRSRQGVFVYLYHLKQSKQLRRFGTISYVSRRMKYVVLYMDSTDVSENIKKIEKLRFVKGVELSERPNLKTEYESNLDSGFKQTEEDCEKNKEAGRIV